MVLYNILHIQSSNWCKSITTKYTIRREVFKPQTIFILHIVLSLSCNNIDTSASIFIRCVVAGRNGNGICVLRLLNDIPACREHLYLPICNLCVCVVCTWFDNASNRIVIFVSCHIPVRYINAFWIDRFIFIAISIII